MTALDPVTFTTAASAVSSITAAVLEAKVSGSDVPMATKVMAVMASGRPRQHPKMAATSPMMAVTNPMKTRERMKQSYAVVWQGGGEGEGEGGGEGGGEGEGKGEGEG